METETDIDLGIVPKYVRLGLFIEQVKDNDKKFDDPEKVNLYLQGILKKIEEELVSDINSRIRVWSLRFFKYSEIYRIWVFERKNHCVLIHTNGSYGIYKAKKPVIQMDSIEFYKEGSTKILEINSSLPNHTLWMDVP